MCTDNTSRSDFSVIEDGGSHADQTPISDGASVNDGAVTNRHIFSNNR
jgi:hypothetical protein